MGERIKETDIQQKEGKGLQQNQADIYDKYNLQRLFGAILKIVYSQSGHLAFIKDHSRLADRRHHSKHENNDADASDKVGGRSPEKQTKRKRLNII